MSDVMVGFCLPVYENFTWNWKISKRELQSQNAQTFFPFSSHQRSQQHIMAWFSKETTDKKLMHF